MTGVPVPAADADAREQDAPSSLFQVLALAFVLAACSILYEMIAAQALSLLAADTVVWYSLVVGVFVASMGIGAFLSRRVRHEDEWRALYRIEVMLAFLGAACVTLLRLGHSAYMLLAAQGREGNALFAFLGTAFVVVAAIGTLTGIELPLLMRIGRTVRDESRSANLVLGVDYLGSLAGALLFPLVVLPNMGLIAAGLAVALVNLAAAVTILPEQGARRARVADRVLLGACALVVLAGVANAGRLEQYLLRRFYYSSLLGTTWGDRFAPRPDLPPVLHARSAYQNIDLVNNVAPDVMAALMPAYSSKLQHEPDFPLDRYLVLNGDFQTNTRYEEVYHEWFAHVPVIAGGKVPARVLLLGGGDGFVLREILKYEGVQSVRHIDLDPVLLTLAKNDPVLHRANHDSFRDPRVRTTIEDGFQFVRRSREQFDAIYIDFPAAANYDLAKLYSREFFEFVRRRVAPGGYAVFDATGTSLLTERGADGSRFVTPENDWPVYYATLRAAGWPTIVPYLTTLETDNEEALGILQEFQLDPSVEQSLAGIEDPEERERQLDALHDAAVRGIMQINSIQLEQGFIVLFPEERTFRREWHDPGVTLYVLDEARYEHSFDVEFPQPAEIDPKYVNSILRPALPRQPWWIPRSGY